MVYYSMKLAKFNLEQKNLHLATVAVMFEGLLTDQTSFMGSASN